MVKFYLRPSSSLAPFLEHFSKVEISSSGIAFSSVTLSALSHERSESSSSSFSSLVDYRCTYSLMQLWHLIASRDPSSTLIVRRVPFPSISAVWPVRSPAPHPHSKRQASWLLPTSLAYLEFLPSWYRIYVSWEHSPLAN